MPRTRRTVGRCGHAAIHDGGGHEGLSVLLRLLCVAVLSIGLGGVTAAAGSSGTAKAAPTRP
ncbi:hypothetical protein BZL30_3817 [Mycobacterium kansasii]|uniref:Uncharacterized protein n=1 Tax=Mycobacterium kansasii TaxID=1768 RepID=A0A1V3XBB6_MYCKA|nr:hypothetical protein BZL30_3817 [Mycobacterium kansasii]